MFTCSNLDFAVMIMPIYIIPITLSPNWMLSFSSDTLVSWCSICILDLFEVCNPEMVSEVLLKTECMVLLSLPLFWLCDSQQSLCLWLKLTMNTHFLGVLPVWMHLHSIFWSNRFTHSCKSAYFALGYAQHLFTPPPILLPVFFSIGYNPMKRERAVCSVWLLSMLLTSDVLNMHQSFGRLPLVLLTGSVIVGAVLGTGGW